MGSGPRYQAGTHRLDPPAETVRRVKGLCAVMGITRVANVTGLDCVGIPVVMVCRPNSRALTVCQGKGQTLDDARASGLMEAVESYHAERIHLPLRLASSNELRFSHALVDTGRMPRPAGSRFCPDSPLLWIEGRELLSDTPRWLPYETVHCDFRLPFPTGSGMFHMSSNGLASGNHVLEALSHALCELVERDASAWMHHGGDTVRRERRLDLDTVRDPGCRRLLDRFEQGGVAVAVWETTTDVGLPAFDSVIVEREPDPLRPLPAFFGAGCHPAREVALSRALTEAAQSRLTAISGARDDMDRPGFERSRHPDTVGVTHRRVTGGTATRRFQDVPTWGSESPEDDVRCVLARLQAAGIDEVVAVDLTKAELGIPVVKVVVPQLEAPHTLAGYVPGPRVRDLGQP